MRFARWLDVRQRCRGFVGRRSRRLAVPRLEALEDRLTPSTLIPVTNYRDLVFDPGRDLLYITASDGTVQRWDVAGQQLLSAWTVGSSLNGADITPDGSSLYVAENKVSGEGLFYQVNLNTGSVTDVPYTLNNNNEAGSWDIAIDNAGNALVTTWGYGGLDSSTLRELDTATNIYSTRSDEPGGGIDGYAMVHRSAEYSLLMLTDTYNFSGPLYYYNPAPDKFSSAVTPSLYGADASPVVNRDGTLMAMEVDGGASIFDTGFHAVQNLSGLTGGVAFDPSQDVLYGVNPTTDMIYAYDTNTWTLKYTLPVGESISTSSVFGTGTIVVSPDDKYLFLTTASGIREYNLPQATGMASSLVVSGFPQFIENGVSGTITVTAEDPAGNVVTNYTGTVHFSSNSAGTLPPDYTFTTADQGSHTFTLTLTSTGLRSITVTDQANGLTGSETNIIVHDPGVSLIPVTDYQDLVYDPTRNILYITTSDGTVQRYDVATQTLLAPFQVGNRLEGADITPDDSSLFVADDERGATQGWFHQVNLTTGAVTNVSYWLTQSAEGSWDIAIANNGIALATIDGENGLPLYAINVVTDAISTQSNVPGIGGTVAERATLSVGADRSLILLQESPSSNGAFFFYNPAWDDFAHNYTPPVEYCGGSPVVNRNGTLAALEVNGGASIFSANSNAVQNLSGLTGGLAFDPSKDILYGVNPTTDLIYAYDTNTWALKYTLPVGETISASSQFGTGTIVVSPDDKYLFLTTASGIREYNLPQATGVASSLVVSGFPQFIENGVSGTITVTAEDPAGNVVTNYTGTVHFSSNSAGTLPPDYTFTTADQGSHTFTLTLTSTGLRSITVTDQANGLTGSETNIIVHDIGTNYIPISDYSDLVYDPTRNVLWITTSIGTVQPYDVATETLLAPFQVGNLLKGADITPDGSSLYIADEEWGATQGWFHQLNLNTGAVTNIPYWFSSYELGSWDVAIANNGIALATTEGNGWLPLRQINTATDALSIRTDEPGGTVQPDTDIAHGPDRGLLDLTEGFSGEGPMITYDPTSNDFPSYNGVGFYDLLPAVNRNDSLIAAFQPLRLKIYDANLGQLQALSNDDGGLWFDPTEDILYFADFNTDNIIAYNTTTWNVFYQLPIGESMGDQLFYNFGVGMMSSTSDGSLLFLGTPTEIRIYHTRPTLSVSGFPSTVTAGTAGNVTVTVISPDGATDTSYQGTVHFSSSDQQAGLPADYTFLLTDQGTHTFTVTLKTAGSQSITATDAANDMTGTQSSITVNPAAADDIGFGVQPGNNTAGAVFNPVVQVDVLDKYGNVEINDNSDQVSLAIGNNPGGGRPGGTTTLTVSAGVASFSNLAIELAGTGYTLTATLTGMPVVVSNAFNIIAAAPDQLAFNVQPSNGVAGGAISPAVKVQLLDQYGNLVSWDNSELVTLSVASGPGGFAGGSITTVTANGGVATFSNLILETAGTYTLGESATGGLTGPNSSSFTISPAAADHLGFSVEPGSSEVGYAISPPVMVQVFDKYGNLVSGDNSGQITLSVASGPAGFAAGSTTTVTVSGGIAIFSNLILDTVGNYTLSETSSGGLTGPDSTSFTIIPPIADHLGFSVQPSTTTAGVAISPAVKVEVFDQFGHLFTGDNSDQVTLTVGSGPGGFDPDSTSNVKVSGGIATFNNLIFDTAGAYTLAESVAGGLTGPNSSSFAINPAAAAYLGFSVQPSNSQAGVAISPAVQVQVFDKYGNFVSGDNTDQATLSVASGPGNFAGGSSTTVTVSGGIATFSNLILDTAGNYTLAGNSTGGLTGPNSSSFTITPASADHLGFSVQPSATEAGVAISPTVQVRVLDKYGNFIPGDNSGQVTLFVASGPGGFTSGSTTTVALSGGFAAFSNLILDTAGNYTLAEVGTGGLSGPTSTSFTINPGPPDHLAFNVQPSNINAGNAISPGVQVNVLDQYGNTITTDNSDQVTLAVASGPGGFASGSTTTVTVSAGIAMFTNLIFHTAGTYTLGESATGGLTRSNSNSFTIHPSANDSLSFTVQPSNTTAGVAISPAVKVAIFDQFGNLLSGDNTDQITLVVASGPGSFTSGSTTTVTVSGGVATFSSLILTTAGSYTLAESGTAGLSGPNSGSFTVTASTPNHLGFTVQPSSTAAGAAVNPAVQVSVLDQYGNFAPGDNGDQVTLSIAAGPGGFASGSTTTETVSGGIATFSNLILDTVGAYDLAEHDTAGLYGTNSNSFIVNPGTAATLGFSVQPSNTTAGAVISPAVKVKMFDAYGNLETTDNSDQVTLSVATGPGGFATGSTTTMTVGGGIAIFSNLILATAGSYTLGESATGGLTGPDSSSFSVSPSSATHLGFSVQPGNTPANVAISPAVKVGVLDQYGNTITSDNSDEVTLSIASGPGGFDFSSTITEVTSAGVATFSNLILDTLGTYTLGEKATSGLSGGNSSSFTVLAGLANHLVFSVPPSNTTAATPINPAVQVEVCDKYGNVLSYDNSDQVTLAVATGPGSFDPASTTTVTVSGGIATFANLMFDTGGAYILSESGTSGLTGAASRSFTVFPAAADHLGFTEQPSNTTSGLAISPDVTVAVFDRFGNVLIGDYADQVTLTVADGPADFSGDSTTTVTVNGGIATFSNLILDTAGSYSLGMSATGGLSGVNSGSFTVSPTAADHLAFGVQPSDTTAGAAISPAVQVGILDKYGNLLTADNSDPVTLSVAGGPGGFAAGSKTTATVSGGIATFSSLILDTAGSYQLADSGPGGLTGPNSRSFTVNSTAADHLAFSVQPSNTAAGTAITPTVQVKVFDTFGNLLTNDNSDQVTVSIASGPGGFTADSTPTVTVINGVATFTNLILDTAGKYLPPAQYGRRRDRTRLPPVQHHARSVRSSELQRATQRHDRGRCHQPRGTGQGARPVQQPDNGRKQRSGHVDRRQRTGRLLREQRDHRDRQRRDRHLQQSGSRHGRYVQPERNMHGRTERTQLEQFHCQRPECAGSPGVQRPAHRHHRGHADHPGGAGGDTRSVRQPTLLRQQRPGNAYCGQRAGRLCHRQHDHGDRQRRHRHLQQPRPRHGRQLHASRERSRRSDWAGLQQLYGHPRSGAGSSWLQRAARQQHCGHGQCSGGAGRSVRPVRQSGQFRQQRPGNALYCRRTGGVHFRQHDHDDGQRRRRHLQQPRPRHCGKVLAYRERHRRIDRAGLQQLHGRGRDSGPSEDQQRAERHDRRRGHQPGGAGATLRPLRQSPQRRQ